MRALVAAAVLALLAPAVSAQHHARTEREIRHRAPSYGEATSAGADGYGPAAPRRLAPSYGEAPAGRTLVRSERIVTHYYDGGEARQTVEREPAPQWIRDEAAAFRSAPAPRIARRAALDGVTYGDGSRYRGDLVRGLPHGAGAMTYADGSAYDGDFRDGVPHGLGTYRTATGDVLTGTFLDGVLTDGEARYASGDRYEGAFLEGRPHGQGAMDYADGASYDGAFRSGRPDGWGVYHDASGEPFEGAWTRGHLDDGREARAPAERRRVDQRRADRRRADRRARQDAWR